MVALGLALLILGTALLIAEAHLPTYGLLGVAGVAALAGGAAVAVDGSGGSLLLVLAVALLVGVTAAGLLTYTVRETLAAGRRRAKTGTEALIGRIGVIRSVPAPLGQVFVDGALWRARPCWSDEPEALHEGDPVVVERVQGLTLSVRRAEEWEIEP